MENNICPRCGINIISPVELNVLFCLECTEIGMPYLTNWFVITGSRPPSSRIHGTIFNDTLERFVDGSFVITSPVMDIEGSVVTTKSGNKYTLGNPHRSMLNL